MSWSSDISAAPRGKTITVTRKVKTADGLVDREFQDHVPETFLMATTEGKVVSTYWIPPTKHTPNGRFSGFSENSNILLAWQPMPAPPVFRTEQHVVDLPIIEDCGSGA